MSLFVPSSLPAGNLERRRIALLQVAPEIWLSLIQSIGHHRITQVGIPVDAEVLAAHYDPYRRVIVLTLESESFEALPPDAHPSEIYVSLTDHGPWEIPESA